MSTLMLTLQAIGRHLRQIPVTQHAHDMATSFCMPPVQSSGHCNSKWKSNWAQPRVSFIGLSTALRATIPIMELVKELKGQGFDMVSTQPTVHCRVFGDNSSALKIAKVPKMRLHTKHINIKFHHFRDYINCREITLHAINTHDQPADMLTKPLAAPMLTQHHATIMGCGRKGSAERECEDIHHGHVQQCHEPVGNSNGTKSMQGCSTRPLRKVSFSQSGPTTIGPDLNNVSTWPLRLPRPGPYTMAHAAHFNGVQAYTTGCQTRTFHLTFWLAWSPSSKASPRSLNSL